MLTVDVIEHNLVKTELCFIARPEQQKIWVTGSDVARLFTPGGLAAAVFEFLGITKYNVLCRNIKPIQPGRFTWETGAGSKFSMIIVAKLH